MPKDPSEIPEFLSNLRDDAPADLQHYFLTFEDFWERKLWHELTDTLLDYFNLPESASYRLLLFHEFVKHFSEKINQLKLVNLGLLAATQSPSKFSLYFNSVEGPSYEPIPHAEYNPVSLDEERLNWRVDYLVDDKARLGFLNDLAEKVDKPSSQDAFVMAKSAVARMELRRGDQEGARKDLDRCQTILDSFDSVETAVHAQFYSVNGDYYQTKREFAYYYRNALLYLACIEVSDLAPKERQTRAYDLAIAALISDSIYNFGELLLHPILDALKETPHIWLRDMLFAFNAGDLRAYDSLIGNIQKNELLREHEQFLHQKISLAALTEAVFKRAPHERSMTFAEIEKETKVKKDEIEHLIMKALSLGLIKGTIDQVAEVASITWVQPKVLNMEQIEGMRVRLKEWDNRVNQLGTWMEGVGKDVWAT